MITRVLLTNQQVFVLPLSSRWKMQWWDSWVDETLSKLASLNLLRSVRPISLLKSPPSDDPSGDSEPPPDGPRWWDRSSVEVEIEEPTFRQWLRELPGPEGESFCKDEIFGGKLILFSGNDYLGLSCHPVVRKAAAKAALEHGMGPRGSALICGYTDYHKLLEATLADLKKKEDCIVCPTGFGANLAFMSTLGSVSSLLAVGRKPSKGERVAIFSDALNHASIIDGIRLAERQLEAEVFVYKHCDMIHLNTLLLFSMDGDFAPISELVELRKKYGFLLVIDDAHATLVCGKNGGGLPEVYGCENDVDICIGTLSKAAGCQGGFIACSNKWKQLIQSRGRSFIFSTSLPVPIAAASLAALGVARKEKWRRRTLWSRVHAFRSMTQLHITSPIISLVIGSEDSALRASRHVLKSGFHVMAIRPPTVPPNSCRLRITLSAAHTSDDIRRLVDALSIYIKFPAIEEYHGRTSKL